MLVFSSIAIVEDRMFVYTCVFFNRMASLKNLNIITRSIKTQFLIKMVDSCSKKAN